MNLMTIAIIAVLILFAWSGLKKGLVRKLTGITAMLISLLLVNLLLPFAMNVLRTSTPVYEIVEQKCEQSVEAVLDHVSGVENVAAEQAGRLLDGYGVEVPAETGDITEYAKRYFDITTTDLLNRIGKNDQTRLIGSLPLPDFLKNLILSYNNSEGYRKLGASGFGEYLVSFLANLIVNIAAFLITILVVSLIVRCMMGVLHVFSRLPLVSSADHFGGLLIGLLEGLIAVWGIFSVISLFSGTRIGMEMMKMIDESAVLRPLYESNLFMRVIAGSVGKMVASR